MKKKIVVVMPAYNAGRKIQAVYDGMRPGIMSLIDEFVIVDDGAVDDTLEKAKNIQQRVGKVHIVVHKKNKGYGAAQKTGFKKALERGADICVLLHSDGQTDPERIPDLVAPLLNDEADMVLGSRMLSVNPFKTPMPLYKYCGNKLLTFFENLAYHSSISEFHTGYIAYSRKALEAIPYEKLDDRFHFDGHMIIMALINKLRIAEAKVPIIYDDEKSHLKAFSYGMDVFRTIWRYKKGYFHQLADQKIAEK